MTNRKKPATATPKKYSRDHKRQQKHWKRKQTEAFLVEWRKVIDEYVAKAAEPKPVDETEERLYRHAWALMGQLIENNVIPRWQTDVLSDEKPAALDDIHQCVNSLYLSLVGIGLDWHD